MVKPIGGKEEPPLSSSSISSLPPPSQVLSWELLPLRAMWKVPRQGDGILDLFSRALSTHRHRVSWGWCRRQRPGLQPSRLAWPQPSASFFSFPCSFWPGFQLLPILRGPHTPPHPHGNTQKSSLKQRMCWKEGTLEPGPSLVFPDEETEPSHERANLRTEPK